MPGPRFLEGFNYLREKYDHVGDCRGKGLMMAMEFVESKSTNTPLPVYKCMAILERTKVWSFHPEEWWCYRLSIADVRRIVGS